MNLFFLLLLSNDYARNIKYVYYALCIQLLISMARTQWTVPATRQLEVHSFTAPLTYWVLTRFQVIAPMTPPNPFVYVPFQLSVVDVLVAYSGFERFGAHCFADAC